MSLLATGISLAWEAPQTVLGAAFLMVEKVRGRVIAVEREDGRLVVESRGTGVSLGHFVFWTRETNRWHKLDERNRAHELGHAKQSRMLGWFYLPLVGLPSISRAGYALVYREFTGKCWTKYYDGYPENWADRLGGVTRNEVRLV